MRQWAHFSHCTARQPGGSISISLALLCALSQLRADRSCLSVLMRVGLCDRLPTCSSVSLGIKYTGRAALCDTEGAAASIWRNGA